MTPKKCLRCGDVPSPDHFGLCCTCSETVANGIIEDARSWEEQSRYWTETLRLAIQRTISHASIRGRIRHRLEEAVNSGERVP